MKIEPPMRDIWQWIINANNGAGGDVDDLIDIMNRHGLPCPEDMDTES